MRNALFAGAFARWQIGGETKNTPNEQNHLNGDVAELVVFARRLSQVFYCLSLQHVYCFDTFSQCEVVGIESYLRYHWNLPLEVLS
jgi:hypothetical protein